MEASTTRDHEFMQGMRMTLPLVVGAVPFGIIFGALAAHAGLTPAAAQAMSLFVFAGSAQFIATGLVAGGAGLGLIVLTTFVVNLRHMLYSVSLAPHMKHLPQRWLLPLGFWLTDESYVVVIERYNRGGASPHKHWFFLGSALLIYVNWQAATFIGIRAGQAIADPQSWGLDFALPVTFIGMLVPMLCTRPMAAAAVVGGGTAMLLHGLPHQLGLMAATLLGVATGVYAQTWSAAR